MELLIALCGLACVVYTSIEIAFAARPRRFARHMGFGAVDVSTGKSIDVTLDRRRSDRRSHSCISLVA